MYISGISHDLARYTSQLTPIDEVPLPGNQIQSIARYAVSQKKPSRCINLLVVAKSTCRLL